MNLQFLSIGQKNGKDVAYFLDLDTKTAHAFNVVDHTGDEPAPRSAGPIEMPIQQNTVPTTTPPAAPSPPKKTIMPPGVAAMMRDGNEMRATPAGIEQG